MTEVRHETQEKAADYSLKQFIYENSGAVGGKFAGRLSGEGFPAIAIRGEPPVLPVTPENPLSTDPRSTIVWTESLTPKLKTGLMWCSRIAHGDGNVVVQPSEDPTRFTGKKLKKLL